MGDFSNINGKKYGYLYQEQVTYIGNIWICKINGKGCLYKELEWFPI